MKRILLEENNNIHLKQHEPTLVISSYVETYFFLVFIKPFVPNMNQPYSFLLCFI